MPYYSGDYYRGDYYKGDPGFLSTLGGIIKGVGGFIPGVGGLISGAGGMLEKLGTKAAPAAAATAGAMVPAGFFSGATAKIGSRLKGVGTVMKAHPVLTAAGAAGLAGAAAGAGGMALRAHLAGGKRHRRMRVTNPKALRRAIRRTQGFAKLAMKTMHLVHPTRKARFGGFKRRKRARR